MRVLDLFSGIGGFSLAAHAVGFETAAFCEIEPYAQTILRRHFPGVPIFDDVKELTADALAHAESVRCEAGTDGVCGGSSCGDVSRELRHVTSDMGQGKRGGTADPLILTAGFPCQDISYAGKGAGLAGERSGLFYEVARLVGELRPDYVLLENVSALLTRGLDAVLGTLASLRYDALWACIPACAVGAPHRRDRVWLLAIPESPDSKQRLEAMYAHVLSRLTPFGDLREGWPTATASDAWGNELDRNGVVGKHNLGLGQAARDTWSTPTVDDANNVTRASGAFQSLTRDAQTWPTTAARDYKGVSGTGRQERKGNPLDTLPNAAGGSLNPDWVETLMGYPIGYTLPDGDPMCDLPSRWPAGLGAPQYEWEPPRLTSIKENRSNRLKALGNSIVPEVALRWMEAISHDSRKEGRYAP